MAGNSLNTQSTLQCPHGGTVKIVSSNTKTKADQAHMATEKDSFSIVGCPYQIPGSPPIPSPCVEVQWRVADSKVKVNGVASLSQSSVGLCLSATKLPQGPVVIKKTQSKVSSL